MKLVTILLSSLVLAFACRPAKKVQKIQLAISKVDTTPVVVPKDNKAVDSSKLIAEIYNKVIKNKIDFKTFNAKVRVEYSGKEGEDEATAYIRLSKDSVIWLSLRGPLGIEGFRVFITSDSVKVMDLVKKNVQYRSISYLHDLTDLPLDFTTVQDMIVGNPVFTDSNIISYGVNNNNELLVLMIGRFFKHLVTLDKSNYKLIHSKLDDINSIRNRTCQMTFADYDNAAGVPFSTKRNISVSQQSKLDVNLDFKQYAFNQPLTFPFNIPKNYKKL
jgi:hypothetical protein